MPDRTSPASILDRLNTLARKMGLPKDSATQTMLVFYLQEGFFARLRQSPYREQFLLGGGLLLYRIALGPQVARQTQDADLLCRLERNPTVLLAALHAITQLPAPDGIRFDSQIGLSPIETAGPEGGYRARIQGAVGAARAILWLDLAWEPVTVPPQEVALPTLLNPAVSVPILGCAVEAILADKIASMLKRGQRNSRSKDYYDVWLLARTRDFEGETLETALRATCAWQSTAFDAAAEVFSAVDFPTNAHQLRLWQKFITEVGLEARAPTFAEAIHAVRALYGPVLRGEVQRHTWNHASQRWRAPRRK